jgi:uncharacterized protein
VTPRRSPALSLSHGAPAAAYIGAAWLARIIGVGAVLGVIIEGILVAHVSSSLLKLLLGALLIGSAIKVFWRHEG